MIYTLILMSYLNYFPVFAYEVGPMFIDKESCEAFAKQIPRTKYNSYLCVPTNDKGLILER